MKAITTLKPKTRFAGMSLLLAGALGSFFGLATAQAEGLAEKAGQQIDQTADKAGQAATDIKESASRTAESTGEYMDDSAITAKVKWAILRDPDLKTLEISVVNDRRRGVVDRCRRFPTEYRQGGRGRPGHPRREIGGEPSDRQGGQVTDVGLGA